MKHKSRCVHIRQGRPASGKEGRFPDSRNRTGHLLRRHLQIADPGLGVCTVAPFYAQLLLEPAKSDFNR